MKYKKIHFVGIKGVGMTPLAIIAKEAGFKVSGCDIKGEFITNEALKRAGIVPLVGFSKKHINGSDLVVTTGAHGGFNNVEVQEARRQGIKVLTQGEAVGIFMFGKIFDRSSIGISVAGTHGKTTTTAMVATILKENGFDPSFVVGTGEVSSLGAPGHYGKGDYFVAEADEYATEPNFNKTAKFLWQKPKIAIITNIEFDHPDVYSSIDEVRNAFLKFANQLPKDGLLITCGDSKAVQRLLKEYKGRRLTYGFSKGNDFVVSKIYVSHPQSDSLPRGKGKAREGVLEFNVAEKKHDLGKFSLNVFGDHNALNATAAIIASLEVGIDIDNIKKFLLKFVGTKRRSEYIGQLLSGALVFDDYAHHPTEIKKTLESFRSRFLKSKIVCIFQPHTYSRTKSLFEQFVHSFDVADSVIVTNIFASLREKPDGTISSKILSDAMTAYHNDIIFLPKAEDVVEYIDKKNYREGTILITMGAGDIYKINSKFEYRNSK